MTERSHPSPEDRSPNTPQLSMRYVAEHLGFQETEGLKYARLRLTEAMRHNSEDVRTLADNYQQLAEAIVDATPDSAARNIRRVGANIAMALIRIDAGRIEHGTEDLYSILDDLAGMIADGYDMAEIAERIQDILSVLAEEA